MSQTVTTSFSAQSAQSAKSLDYAFVIAGWPTIYTVAKENYTLAGDFANFSAPIHAWANIADCQGARVKGRPEEGGLSIGQMDIGILDRLSGGVRTLTDLLSRQAYLEGTSPGQITTLTAALDNSAATVTVASTSGFPTAGTIHIGLECIKYTGTTSTTFTGCTRGYLLTSAAPHRLASGAYSFMPSLYRRPAYLYKGYQNLGLDQWARAFGGVVAGAKKSGAVVTFSVMSTTWDTYTDGKRVLLGPSTNASDSPVFGSIQLTTDVLPGDFTNIAFTGQTANLNNGHHLVRVGGHWMAITRAS